MILYPAAQILAHSGTRQYESIFTIFVPWTTNLKYLSWIGQYDYIEPRGMSTKSVQYIHIARSVEMYLI